MLVHGALSSSAGKSDEEVMEGKECGLKPVLGKLKLCTE